MERQSHIDRKRNLFDYWQTNFDTVLTQYLLYWKWLQNYRRSVEKFRKNCWSVHQGFHCLSPGSMWFVAIQDLLLFLPFHLKRKCITVIHKFKYCTVLLFWFIQHIYSDSSKLMFQIDFTKPEAKSWEMPKIRVSYGLHLSYCMSPVRFLIIYMTLVR